MPPGLRSLVVFTLTSRAPLRHALQPLGLSTLYVHGTRSRYSSIADAMLGRANKSFEASNPKTDLAKQLFPSSSPAQNAKIDEQFKKARQSSQSIGGFTNYTNASNSLRAKSPNIRPTLKQNTANSGGSNGSHSAPSIFSKQDSFQNTPDTIDLTQEDVVGTNQPTAGRPPVDFDLDDFEDDADIDLDIDYELPMSMAPPPSRQQTATSTSPSLPLPKRSTYPLSSQNPPSSAQTWSSSPPSHKLTPPGALKRRRLEDLAREAGSQITEAKEKPRHNKRRMVPWLEERAVNDEIAANQEEAEEVADLPPSTSSVRCLTCRELGHNSTACPKKSKGSPFAFTPKDKRTPWNSTASALAEGKKKLKSRKVVETGTQNQPKSRVAMSAITLSEEQRRVLELVANQQKSVFFTGSAGTGKSVLMRSIIAELRKKYIREPDRIAVTASTGLAACNIGGVTLHSFGGIGLGKEDVPTLVKKIKKNPKAKNRWIRTKVLIIDEISMVDGDLFDKLEGIARALRNNGRPFGGIQLVITGDFFQLPPVPDYDKKAQGVKFAFDAGTWATAIHHTIGLTEVFRQKDPGKCPSYNHKTLVLTWTVFANMLNELRLGKITNETIASFKKLNRKIQYEDALEATELYVVHDFTITLLTLGYRFPTRNEVDNANAYRMRDLVGKPYKYPAIDGGAIMDEAMRDKLLSNMMASKELLLKKGAQVMLIKNLDDGLVNGSLGKVVAFMDEKTFEMYDDEPGILRDDVPMEELTDRGRQIRTQLALKDASSMSEQLYPLVSFTLPDGNFREILVIREEWKVELPNGEVQASRSQLPLILAWALSIHKAQGQTLERVKIDLKKIFEKGQAYVALSRATSQAGLEVHNFDSSKVMAHPRVAQFYNSLYSVNKALEHPRVAKPPAPKKAKTYEEEFMEAKTSHVNNLDFEEEESLMAAYG